MVKNKSVRYLVYVDILGFKKIPEKMAGYDPTQRDNIDEIREALLTKPFREKIEEIQKENKAINVIPKGVSEITGSDSFVFVACEFQEVLKIIDDVSTIKLLMHKKHKYIPLEIAVGVKEIDESTELKDEINRTQTIEFLKENIITPYRKKYKEEHKHNEESIKETFILLTEDVFNEFEGFDKKSCEEISYAGKHFYYLPKDIIERKLKIFDFLQKIDVGEKRYLRIEDLYVEPKNFNKISEKLKCKKIIFLIGDAELGKTYTSIKLLLDSYEEGCKPVYFKEYEYLKQFGAMGNKLDEVIQNRTAIYFEDPWGKTETQFRYVSIDLGDLIGRVSEVDTRVIITSREKIFKKLEEKKETTKNLWQHVEKLKINLAYSKENLKDMLERYLMVFEPKWCGNEKLKRLVIGAIDNETLKTPMSIKSLIYSRRAKKTDDENILNGAIKRASEATKIAFGKEIIDMFKEGGHEEIVFLSFPYISDYFDLDLIEKHYDDFLEFLNKKYGFDQIKAKTFDSVLNWFREEEMEVYSHQGKDKLKFSHPSYSDGFSYALDTKELCEKIFCNLIKQLSEDENEDVRMSVGCAIVNNFDKFPGVAQELLIKLTVDKSANVRLSVANAAVNNSDKFPELSQELLTKLSNDEDTHVRKNVEYARNTIANIAVNNSDKFPELSQKLLIELSNDDDTIVRARVPYATANNSDKFPELARELLIKLSKDKNAYVRGNVADAVNNNFDKFPELARELLIKLSKDKNAYVRGNVADAVNNNFDKFSELSQELLVKLSDDKSVSVKMRVANAVVNNFDKFSELAHKILTKLSDDKDVGVRKGVVDTITNNFDKFPELSQELLIKLSEDKDAEVRLRVPYAVSDNFDKFSELAQKLLIKLSDDEHLLVRKELAYAVTNNFDKFSELAQKLLIKLSEDKDASVRRSVANTINNNFDKFPELAQKLLIKLSEDKDVNVRESVARAIANNFNKLPREIQNLLDKLQREMESRIERLSKSEAYWDKKEAVDLISNAKSKLRKEFVVEILTKLSSYKDGGVGEKAILTLKGLK